MSDTPNARIGIGSRLSERYELVEEIGRGGMGVVYRARDPLLDRDVAVKMMSASALSDDAIERFEREARVVARMDHPAIVSVYDFGRTADAVYFVMPLVRGTNLRALMAHDPPTLGEVLDAAIDVAEALDYSHAAGVVHRDIKPENIMAVREGGRLRVRVTDFGLAISATDQRLTGTGMVVGTISYLAPEQVRHGPMDGRTDVYALGTVLYECLVGRPPFTGDVASVLYRLVHEFPEPPSAAGVTLDPELEAVVMRCLEKDPARRPQRAREVADVLRRLRQAPGRDARLSDLHSTAAHVPGVIGTALIGREAELAEMQRRLSLAIAGECQLVLLGGPSGIGKSRLADEIEQLAIARQIPAVRGRFVEHDRAFSYQGFCELVQAYFRARHQRGDQTGALTGDTATGAPVGNAGALADVAADLVALFPVLAEVRQLRTRSGEVARPALTADNRTQVFELLSRTIARMSDGLPLVVVLEDLHGADVSVEALQYVVRRLSAAPILVVATYDSSQAGSQHPLARLIGDFRGDRRFVHLAMGPLTPEQHSVLVTATIGSDRFDASFLRRIYEATDGNPYFTKELLRALVDAGRIRKNPSGAWTLASDTLSTEALPATIQQAVEKRIERLAAPLREVLQVASVLGRTFEFRDLQALVESRDALDDAMDDLVKGGFLEEERESRSDRLSFSSGVVRDILYGTLPRRRRKALHRRAAEALETRNAGKLERVLNDLLHHWAAADVPEKVTAYGLALARRSLDAFSVDDAMRVASVVLEFVDQQPAVEAESRLLLGEACRAAGRSEDALRELGRAIALFEAGGAAPRLLDALLLATDTAWESRRVDETLRFAEKALPLALAAGQPEQAAKLLSVRGTVANLRGEYDKAQQLLAEADALRQSAAGPAPGQEGGTLVATVPNPVHATLPVDITLTDESEILSNVYETLLRTDSRGKVAAFLAESWQVAAGGHEVRLVLRDSVMMHDGHPLDAEVVRTALEQAVLRSAGDLPPAVACLEGVDAFAAGDSPAIAGVTVASPREIHLRLREPLPLYPALLSDPRTAIFRLSERLGVPVGSGPFILGARSAESVMLRRFEAYWGEAARVERLEFRTGLGARDVRQQLVSGWIDIGRDLVPQDLDALLNDRRRAVSFAEAPKKNTYFLLFNAARQLARSRTIPHALAALTRKAQLVQKTLGRFVEPAEGLLPPGVLGHEAGRRHRDVVASTVYDALRLLPITLRAAVHPAFRDHYAAFTDALVAAWKDAGVNLSLDPGDMAGYVAQLERDPVEVDLVLGRWNPDYDDPDSFVHGLFHSRAGRLRRFYSSAALDQMIEAARSEADSERREPLYHQIEAHLQQSGVLVPLFHDIDYRVAGASVHGMALRSAPPFVNYAQVTKSEVAPDPAARQARGGVAHVPFTGRLQTLDPAMVLFLVQAEVVSNVYETLTREAEGARIVPWLAESVTVEERGRRFRVRLREGVRFHDGRRLTARDVRWSFERLLQSPDSQSRFLLSSIKGARALIDGTASELAGLRIVSGHELTIDLEQPVAFFPALLAYSPTAVVPEGATRFDCGWQEGCGGTGPFRVARLTEDRLDLEPNPYYWRSGLPRSDGLVFHFGVETSAIVSEFRAGRYSLAWDLPPADIEALRQDPAFAAQYRENPRLSTYYLIFNTHAGPLRDEGLRHHLVDTADVRDMVLRNVRRIGMPAHSLIPPGLLGYEARASARPPVNRSPRPERVSLRAHMLTSYESAYAGLKDDLFGAWKRQGFDATTVGRGQRIIELALDEVDIALNRWMADYPDADNFVHDLIHSQEGLLGRFCGRPEIDRLIDQGRVETEPTIRHEIYREIEMIIDRHALLLPLFHEQAYCFARPEVEGYRLSTGVPIVPYEELSLRR